MQILMALIYLFAVTCTYWTHIETNPNVGNLQATDYRFTLTSLRWDAEAGNISLSSDNFELAAKVSYNCHHSSDPNYPQSVCERSRALFLGGLLVSSNGNM